MTRHVRTRRNPRTSAADFSCSARGHCSTGNRKPNHCSTGNRKPRTSAKDSSCSTRGHCSTGNRKPNQTKTSSRNLGNRRAFLPIVFALGSLWFMVFMTRSSKPLLHPDDLCYDFRTSQDLLNFVGLAEGDASPKCRTLIKASKEMFDLQLETGRLGHVEQELKAKIETLLGHDSDLIGRLYSQTILHVHNKWTREATVINPLKAKRPGQSNKNNRTYVMSQISSSEPTCDFCSAEKMTAQDSFGRIKGDLSLTAANLFTISGPHSGLVISATHSFLELDAKVLADMLEVAGKWYQQTNKHDPELVFPSMSWDVLTHAGASQIHPHLHMYLDRRRHQGHFDQQYAAADAYNAKTGRDYWDDMTQIHTNMGLAVHKNNSSILVPLTSKKDHEFLVIYRGHSPHELGGLLHTIVQTYTEHLSVLCWNMGAAWPPLSSRPQGASIWEPGRQKAAWSGVRERPVLVRMGSRGDCSSLRSDVSTHELYIFYGLNVDPYESITKLKHVVGANR